MKKPATKFYTKKTNDIWKSHRGTFYYYLQKHKFYVDGGWFKKKIFNIIMWILKKLNLKGDIVEASNNTLVMNSFSINKYDLMKMITKHKIDIEYIWEQKPRFLVVGQDVFNELCSSPLMNFLTYEEELPIHRDVPVYDRFGEFYGNKKQYRREQMFWGFKVILVPWINGCFLLPDI